MRLTSAAKRGLIFVGDLFCVGGAFAAAFLLRFDFHLSPENLQVLLQSVPLGWLGYLSTLKSFGLYRGLWRYASFPDLMQILKAAGVASLVTSLLILFAHHGDYSRAVLILAMVLSFLGVCAVRFLARFSKGFLGEAAEPGLHRRALIVGAGDLGAEVLHQLELPSARRHVAVGFVDDDATKWGMHIQGTPVLGGVRDLPRILSEQEGVEEIIVAVSSRRGDVVRSVADALGGSGGSVEIKIAPTLNEALLQSSDRLLRPVRPADLLNRQEVQLDEPRIARFLAGKTVLVTGAGGTIGRQLCRQAARYGPRKLLMLDNHATSLFYVDSELRRDPEGKAQLLPLLGNTQDRSLLEDLFREHRPEVVLHAAAHKHLPQLEVPANGLEAVKTNLLATALLAECCDRYGAERFLLVSTDKAVRPTSVMGATKRAAELALLARDSASGTRFCSVRFGNVLGSSGSVLPIFEEQIKNGGPLTLTHPDAKRYFMTVEEAVYLILQACSMAEGGEIFALKMGEPVSIREMAWNLLLLHGLRPDKDIRIQYVGLRPGEKLIEELSEDSSDLLSSEHPAVYKVRQGRVDSGRILGAVRELEKLAAGAKSKDLVEKLRAMIPEFKHSGQP